VGATGGAPKNGGNKAQRAITTLLQGGEDMSGEEKPEIGSTAGGIPKAHSEERTKKRVRMDPLKGGQKKEVPWE